MFHHKHDEKKMKKFLNISLLALVALSALTLGSCKNEVDQIFDEDAVARLSKAQAEFTEILTSNGGKWQLEYFANSKEPGYIYLMTFDKNGSVTISGKNKWLGGLDGGTQGSVAYGSATSLWEVITDNGPVLSLNTYNKYFHIFAEPEDIPSMSEEDPDETGYGHEGDYEFDLMKYSNDTLYITGKKYGLNMIMTRVPSTVDDRVYMDEVVAMADSFFHAKIPYVYINLPNGTRWIVKNGASSILKMFREGDDEISTSEEHNVIITHDGLSFMEPLTLDGYTIRDFIRQADGSLLCRNDNQTTMTADHLSTIFLMNTLRWRYDAEGMGGVFADYITQFAAELTAYNKSKFVFAQIDNIEGSRYEIIFNVKRSATTFKPTYYMTIDAINDHQVKFTFESEGNAAGELYRQRCPSLGNIIEALGSMTFDISAGSLLAPVNLRFTDVSNSSNYLYANIM
jgi:hypothetical protein